MSLTLRIFTEPQQGASYDDQLAVAREAESLGFDAFFRSDHYLHMGGVSGLPGPTDSWVTLAGLARDTDRIRLGTMVTAATFRLPGPLAISVAQVDQMSAGRVELGLGSGWYEDEHTAYGIPFPSVRERFDRLEEQLAIVTGLWTTPEGERFSFDGTHYRVSNSPALPKPAQSPRPPVIVGGAGATRTPRLAARYADEYNTPFLSLDEFRTQLTNVTAACEQIDRDPATMRWSASVVACVGADEAEYARRAKAIGREPGELRSSGVAGTVTEALDRLGEFAEAGAQRIYLQVLDLADLDHLRLIASEVAPALA
jgi:F420-dependent oxidoreductase-like protein